VDRVLALSTDKAVNPVNLYGATKLCAEKIFIQGNAYSGLHRTRFSCVRYGNVIGSRGSVVPVFFEQKKSGKITITDERMTRFWITLEQSVRFVIKGMALMQGGEVFVPKIPSMRIVDLAKIVAPECDVETIGIRPGEKLHEALITEEEGRNTVAYEDMFVVMPSFQWWEEMNYTDATVLPEGFVYTSDSNDEWLGAEDLKRILTDSSLYQEASAAALMSTIHKLNERVILHMSNSEEYLGQHFEQFNAPCSR
jgi:UDP-N-acetylglucosamine 4,6-dehydratase